MNVVSSGQKKKKTIQIFPSAKFESQHLSWYGCVLVPMTWATYKSVMAPSMLKGATHAAIQATSFSGTSLLISARHILYALQQRGFVVKEYGY